MSGRSRPELVTPDRRQVMRTVLASAVGAQLPGQARAEADPVEDARFVPLNGVEQWVTIRGRDRRNPVVLILGGGPGIPLSYLARVFAAWEQDFTVVQWDQPGSGATFMKNGGEAGIGTVSVERYAADGLALVEWLRERLGVRRVMLLGYSWGSMVGLTMAARRPDLFSAYVGTGQAVDVRRADALSYQLVLQAARERADAPTVARLEALGLPPWSFDGRAQKQQYATALTPGELTRAAAMNRLLATPAPADASWVWPKALGVYDGRAAAMATQRRGYASAQAWSAAPLGQRFRIPLFVFQGEKDINTVTALVQDYVAGLKAPHKELVLLSDAGHSTLPYFHAELLALLTTRVRPRLSP